MNPPDQQEITPHEAMIFRIFTAEPQTWMTNKDVDKAVAKTFGKDAVAPRTVRHHTSRLAEMDVLSRMKFFDGYRFRLSGKNRPHHDRLLDVIDVLGLDI